MQSAAMANEMELALKTPIEGWSMTYPQSKRATTLTPDATPIMPLASVAVNPVFFH